MVVSPIRKLVYRQRSLGVTCTTSGHLISSQVPGETCSACLPTMVQNGTDCMAGKSNHCSYEAQRRAEVRLVYRNDQLYEGEGL
jgi:hypothetical protein